MIHYQLRCGGGHEFDGWFNNSAGFDAQAERGLLSCPQCFNTNIVRALMAPNLGRSAQDCDAVQAPVNQISDVPGIPDNVRAALQKLRTKIETECDYVGAEFPAESRRMHRGATPYRPIYGESTEEERHDLIEEGVPIQQIPWINRSDS